MVIVVQIPTQVPAFIYFGYIYGIDGPHDNSMFNFLRNYHTVFHSGCTFYIPPSNVHGFHYLYIVTNIFFFKIIPTLIGMRWYLTVVLICFSLKISDAGDLFMCSLSIFMYLLWRNVY